MVRWIIFLGVLMASSALAEAVPFRALSNGSGKGKMFRLEARSPKMMMTMMMMKSSSSSKSRKGSKGDIFVDDSVQVCHKQRMKRKNPFRTISIHQDEWPRYESRGDLLGSCEANCYDVCFNGNLCSEQLVQGAAFCMCTDEPISLQAGEKCCAPYGTIVAQDSCCPDDSCCGLSFEECVQQTFPFQFELDETVTSGPVPVFPIYLISDESIRMEKPGKYTATSLEDAEFPFEVVGIIYSSDFVLQGMLVEGLLTDDEIEAIQDTAKKTFVFDGLAGPTLAPFVGIVTTYFDPITSGMIGYMFALDDLETIQDVLSEGGRRLEVVIPSCEAVAQEALNEARQLCPDDNLVVDDTCYDRLVNDCVKKVEFLYGNFVLAKELLFTKKVWDYGKLLADCSFGVKKPNSLSDFFVQAFKFVLKKNPAVFAACMAAGAIKIEVPFKAAIKAAELLFEDKAKEEAVEKGKQIVDECTDCLAPTATPTLHPSPVPTTLEPSKQPTPRPSRGPTKAPTPKPTNEPTERSPTPPPSFPPNPPGYVSGIFGDPHISTFDRLRFACQAAGVFTTVTSLETPEFKIQELFRDVGSGVCSQASVSIGVVIQEPGLPQVQVSIPLANSDGADVVGTCPVDLFVDGTLLNLSSGTGNPNVVVTRSGSTITIRYPFTGVQATLTVSSSASFGCFFGVQVRLPFEYRSDETILGLLGTPNSRTSDDWIAPDGSAYAPPASAADSIFSLAYNYCTQNWCVTQETDSNFSFRPQETFAEFNRCNVDYQDDVEAAITSASPEIVTLCAGNAACLVDGACGRLEDAVGALVAEEELLVEQQEANPLPTQVPSTSPTMQPSRVPSVPPTDTKSPSAIPTELPTGNVFSQCLANRCESMSKSAKSSSGGKMMMSMMMKKKNMEKEKGVTICSVSKKGKRRNQCVAISDAKEHLSKHPTDYCGPCQ